MGAGNWMLPSDVTGVTVYVDIDQVYTDNSTDDPDLYSFEFDGLVDILFECTSKAFSGVRGGEWRTNGYRSDERLIVAESASFYITVKEWGCYFAISVEIRSDLEPNVVALAEQNLYRVAKNFFINLGKRYTMRMRDTAWTSRPYQPE